MSMTEECVRIKNEKVSRGHIFMDGQSDAVIVDALRGFARECAFNNEFMAATLKVAASRIQHRSQRTEAA